MAVDIMHDVELGDGKAFITHVLRLFQAEGGGAIEEFDARLVLSNGKSITLLNVRSFRKVPTFGRDTIRRFGGSVSSLKKMTARGFEDIIQVSLSQG